MLHPLTRRSPRIAFTLLELVVVIMILATLAGLVIPQVSMLGRSSDMAATSKNNQDVANNLGLFFVLQKRFPQGMDSLLVATTGNAPTGVYVPLDSSGNPTTSEAAQVVGLPVSGPSAYADLTMGTLTNAPGAEFARSLSRCGFDFVFDHDVTVLNSNMSAVLQRALGSNNILVAELEGENPATPAVESPTAVRLIPATPTAPAGVIDTTRFRVVALGFGHNVSATGKTLMNAPIYPGCDGRYYGRYIAFFKVYATGERATLLGVTDSYGRTSDYSIQQFNESLPDDSRQG